MQSGEIVLDHLITHRFPISEAVQAFNTASDRSQAMKVQLQF